MIATRSFFAIVSPMKNSMRYHGYTARIEYDGAASRLFLREIENNITRKVNFSFETTLSGRSYLRLIKRLQHDDWRVELIYFALPNAKMSKLRVAERVAHGGHDIPVRDIERRYPRSLNNLLHLYSHTVDRCICFMNSGEEPILLFEQQHNERTVLHKHYYHQLIQAAAS